MMSDKKRCKKLEKYIQLSELAKFRSYIKRYSIDVTGWSDEKGNSLLHLSCKYGCEVILRYLLKNKADALLKNKVGDLPIHVACHYARKGHKYAETDLVLPLIRNDPTCLDVENGAGVTARQLLQDFKDRVKRTHRWRHCHSESVTGKTSSSHSDSESDSFEEKLAKEMEDEYNAEWGIYEEDFCTYEQEYETWNAWADRMAKEYAARYHSIRSRVHGKKGSDASASSEPSASDIPRISPRKRRLFDKKMKAAQEEHRQHIEQSRREKIGFQKLQYERDCIALYKPTSTSPIGYNDVSWPHPIGKESPLKEVVVEFLFGDLQTGSDTYRSYLRLQRIRWHPDRFVHRCGGRIKDADRRKILDKVNAISQILNSLNEAVGH